MIRIDLGTSVSGRTMQTSGIRFMPICKSNPEYPLGGQTRRYRLPWAEVRCRVDSAAKRRPRKNRATLIPRHTLLGKNESLHPQFRFCYCVSTSAKEFRSRIGPKAVMVLVRPLRPDSPRDPLFATLVGNQRESSAESRSQTHFLMRGVGR